MNFRHLSEQMSIKIKISRVQFKKLKKQKRETRRRNKLKIKWIALMMISRLKHS